MPSSLHFTSLPFSSLHSLLPYSPFPTPYLEQPRMYPAVDRVRRPGDVAGARRGEELDEVGDLFGSSHPFQRNGAMIGGHHILMRLAELLRLLRRQIVDPVGQRIA